MSDHPAAELPAEPPPADDPVLARREGSRLAEELDRAADDAEVRCVVLTGAGRAFCVGADLKAHGEGPPDRGEARSYVAAAQEVNRRIQLGPVPVVAAVNGHAIGGGLELALSADFMVVAEEAKLRFPELALGTFVGGGTVYTLTERVGTLKARELLYLGDFFRGAEAAAWGIAWKALPTDAVLPAALELAGRIAERAPRSVAWAKRLLGPAGTMSRSRALALEGRALEEIFGTRDWREGVEAFHEKRPPEFTGE